MLGCLFSEAFNHSLLKQIKELILHGQNGAIIRKQKGGGRRQETQEGGKDGISISQVSHQRRMSGSLKQSHPCTRWIYLIKCCPFVSLAKKSTCHIKRLRFINGKPLSWDLKDKSMKSRTRILVAQDLSITKVTRVCIHVCICVCTHPPLEHRHLCAH